MYYIAPIEALATERYWHWERKNGKGLELLVAELGFRITVSPAFCFQMDNINCGTHQIKPL